MLIKKIPVHIKYDKYSDTYRSNRKSYRLISVLTLHRSIAVVFLPVFGHRSLILFCSCVYLQMWTCGLMDGDTSSAAS